MNRSSSYQKTKNSRVEVTLFKHPVRHLSQHETKYESNRLHVIWCNRNLKGSLQLFVKLSSSKGPSRGDQRQRFLQSTLCRITDRILDKKLNVLSLPHHILHHTRPYHHLPGPGSPQSDPSPLFKLFLCILPIITPILTLSSISN